LIPFCCPTEQLQLFFFPSRAAQTFQNAPHIIWNIALCPIHLGALCRDEWHSNAPNPEALLIPSS
jgi:hypothetical protein